MQSTFKINSYPSYVLIDHEGIVRYQGKGSGAQTESNLSSAVKKALKALAEAPAQPKTETANSVEVALKKDQNPMQSAATDARPPTAGSGIPVRIISPIRIPKPVVEASRINLQSDSPIAGRILPYRLQVKNWASFPDELFAPTKELPLCAGAGMINIAGKTPVSTRIEIQIMDGQGKVFSLNCSMSSPEMLQSIILQLSPQSPTARVYLQIKDRLTGNMIQSDPIVLP
jgi:hypothetical protein